MSKIRIEQVIKIGKEIFERNDIVKIDSRTNGEIVGRLEYIGEGKIIVDISEKFQSSFTQIKLGHIINIGKTTIY